MIPNIFEIKGPAACKGGKLPANSSPISKVAVAFVVGKMTGLVGWNCYSSALAFRKGVMIVKIVSRYETAAKMADHIFSFWVRYSKSLFEPKCFAESQKEEDFDGGGKDGGSLQSKDNDKQ